MKPVDRKAAAGVSHSREPWTQDPPIPQARSVKHIPKASTRNRKKRNYETWRDLDLRTKPSKIDQAEQLVRQDLRPHQIAQALNTTLGSVRTMLSTLRRRGRIGMWEGRLDDCNTTNIPQPHLMLRLTPEQRMLIDIEAEDRAMTPADLVIHIVSTVMADQRLVEAVLGEE